MLLRQGELGGINDIQSIHSMWYSEVTRESHPVTRPVADGRWAITDYVFRSITQVNDDQMGH